MTILVQIKIMGLIGLLDGNMFTNTYSYTYDYQHTVEAPILMIAAVCFLFTYLKYRFSKSKKINDTPYSDSIQKDILLQDKRPIYPEQEVKPPFSSFKPTRIYIAFGVFSALSILIQIIKHT